MSLLDRWKILIGHITLLPVAGTALLKPTSCLSPTQPGSHAATRNRPYS